MSRTVKIIFWLIVALIVLVLSYQLLNVPVEDSTIKIGFIAPFTGESSDKGKLVKDITSMAVEEINETGGIDGKKIEVIYKDGGCNSSAATSAMQKLASDEKIKVVIGGFCDSESLAAVPIAEENKIFLLSSRSSSADLINISKYFARIYPSNNDQGSVLSEIAYNDKEWKKVAVIQEKLDRPLNIFEAFKSNFELMGGEVVKEEFSAETSDFSPALTKLKKEESDAIFVNIETSSIIEMILKQIRDLKWELPLLVTDVVGSDEKIIEENSKLLEGALTTELNINISNNKFEQLAKDYELKYKEELPFQSYAQTSHDAILMIRDAITEVGYDADKIAEWFRSVEDWQGASGLITLGDDGDRDDGYVVKIILDGKTIELKQDSDE
jgi:branched-chain amino acid transport system substrate-binding protein